MLKLLQRKIVMVSFILLSSFWCFINLLRIDNIQNCLGYSHYRTPLHTLATFPSPKNLYEAFYGDFFPYHSLNFHGTSSNVSVQLKPPI